jgi:heme-degrading monooxygenase HmoA
MQDGCRCGERIRLRSAIMCADVYLTARRARIDPMQVRSIIFFETKPGQEERFRSEFRSLRDAVGFPGFLGGEFAQSVQNPRIFTVTALWENRDAYAAWQARTASSSESGNATLSMLQETLVEVPSGKPYEIVYEVGAS